MKTSACLIGQVVFRMLCDEAWRRLRSGASLLLFHQMLKHPLLLLNRGFACPQHAFFHLLEIADVLIHHLLDRSIGLFPETGGEVLLLPVNHQYGIRLTGLHHADLLDSHTG